MFGRKMGQREGTGLEREMKKVGFGGMPVGLLDACLVRIHSLIIAITDRLIVSTSLLCSETN